jgi:hypothetical protein
MRRERPTFPALQATLLILGLAGVIALWYWLRQPPSAETLKTQIARLLGEHDWNAAQSKFDLLAKHHAETVPREDREELQSKIASMKTYTQAKVVSGPYTFVPPTSEAERFYRRGVLAYYSGQVEEARNTWKTLIAAFKDAPNYSPWVRLAEEALKQSDSQSTFNLDAVIKGYGEMDTANLNARLVELQKLYNTMPDSDWKTSALKAIGEKLKELENGK